MYSHPSSIQCNASSEINSLKSSVSNGKTQVANAITGKGVSASGNDTFATLANKINQIFQLNTSDATATASQILFGYTAYAKGVKIVGNMQPGVNFNNPQTAVMADADDADNLTIPQSMSKCYIIYGGGYYYGLVRIDNCFESNFVVLRASGYYNESQDLRYDSNSRLFSISRGSPDLIFAIGW